MKKFKFLFLICSLSSYSLIGQNTNTYEYQNALKISPIEFAQSQFQITYEHYLNNRATSVLIIPTITLKDNGLESKKGIEGMLQYRFFLSHLIKGEHKTLGMHNIGFFTGPYALGMVYNEEYQRGYYMQSRDEYVMDIFEKDIKAAEVGAIIGIQFDITPKILLDLYVGGGIRYADTEDTFEQVTDTDTNYFDAYDVFDQEYTGVKPKLGLQLGFAF